MHKVLCTYWRPEIPIQSNTTYREHHLKINSFKELTFGETSPKDLGRGVPKLLVSIYFSCGVWGLGGVLAVWRLKDLW